jgi:hypothetical protein
MNETLPSLGPFSSPKPDPIKTSPTFSQARTGEKVHLQLRLNAQSNEEQASDNMQSIIFHLQIKEKQARLNITKCESSQPHFLKTNGCQPGESKIEIMSAPLQNQMTVLRQFRENKTPPNKTRLASETTTTKQLIYPQKQKAPNHAIGTISKHLKISSKRQRE